ncbi:hypothetical protein MNBD_GAMMA16-1102 [hydrothermal vent metagenome]|uniref:Cytochrome c domain-containing protein n=1 Tax=hydrothermal vent metagenome TaxID=652676 RepID=A0A3B0Z5E6_9ZZZZ
MESLSVYLHGALFLGVSLFWSAGLFAEDVAVLNNDSCLSCHSTMSHDAIASIIEANCAECHTAPDITGETNRVSAHLDALDEVDLPLHTNNSDLLPGMAIPQYYRGSRLGGDANDMLRIEAGPFTRGTDNRLPDEGPEHIANTTAYLIDRYEVTNLQYKKFITTTKHNSPDHFENRTYPPGKADHPVVNVTWNDADAYCTWAGKRLPDDKEWEKAARSADARRFPWGSKFQMHNANTPQRWGSLKKEGDTTPVGAFEKGASPRGLYDMSGNVWEWTSSQYEPYPGNTRRTENYDENYKTLKGGSWWDCSFYSCGMSAPSFNRAFFLKTTKNNSFGFRCAQDVGAAVLTAGTVK